MQSFLDLLISINCSTCFRRFPRHYEEQKAVNTASVIVKQILLSAATANEMERSCISSTVAAVLVWQYLTLYVQFCAPDDGRSVRLKYVEQFIEINRSRKRCIFHLHNPSRRNMALGHIQPLAEMSTRNFFLGWMRSVHKADKITTIMYRIS
jgi:hypothetical protein